MEGLRCLVSGSGNVAQFAVEKLLQEGAVSLTMSDSTGYVFAEDGITRELLDIVAHVKNNKRAGLALAAELSEGRLTFVAGEKPWKSGIAADAALPCATQNEVDEEDVQALNAGGCRFVAEGANMPCTHSAVDLIHRNSIRFGPAKAANAGGVAVSALEMAQNSARLSWTREEVDAHLVRIMDDIFDTSDATAAEYGFENNYQMGANIAGFLKVANSVIEQGSV